MTIKKIALTAMTFVLFTALLLCCAIIPASAAEPVNQLRVDQRSLDEAGVWFVLSELLQNVENPNEGFYEFSFTAQDVNPELGGCAYKITTIRGNNMLLRWKRFTSRQPQTGIITMATRFEGNSGDNSPDTGYIPADFITRAAELGQNMIICTQNDRNPFILMEVVVKQIFNDGSENVIYRMSEDPIIQALSEGNSFTKGSMGFAASLGGTGEALSVITVVEGYAVETDEPEERDPIIPNGGYDNTGGDTPPDDPQEETPDPFPSGETTDEGSLLGILIGTVTASLLGALIWAVILSKT